MRNSLEHNDLSPLLIFDGECVMCNRFIVFLVKSLSNAQNFNLTYINSEAAESRLRLAGVSIDRDALVLLEGRSVTTGARAIFAAFSYARRPWKYLSLLIKLPERLTETIYDVVARNRKHIGRQASCPVPDELVAARLIKQLKRE